MRRRLRGRLNGLRDRAGEIEEVLGLRRPRLERARLRLRLGNVAKRPRTRRDRDVDRVGLADPGDDPARLESPEHELEGGRLAPAAVLAGDVEGVAGRVQRVAGR